MDDLNEESDWTLFNRTLTRKTSDQLREWTDRYDRGVTSLATTISVVAALYDTTSGMIDKDLSDLLAEVHKSLISEAKTRKT